MTTPSVLLRRDPSTDQGTPGQMLIAGQPFCATLELPWRDNAPDISCIPPGQYQAVYFRHPTLGHCYHLQGVEGRTEVLIHRGNWAGDASLGFRSDVEGCILPGERHDQLANQLAVVHSTSTMLKLVERLGKGVFTLTIEQDV